ncbi:hypothetical protein ACOME3_009428 [Neoechinorhynchus agilis]
MVSKFGSDDNDLEELDYDDCDVSPNESGWTREATGGEHEEGEIVDQRFVISVQIGGLVAGKQHVHTRENKLRIYDVDDEINNAHRCIPEDERRTDEDNPWDAALLRAKERRERAQVRRMEDKDFNEKRMNLKMEKLTPPLVSSSKSLKDYDWAMNQMDRSRTCSKCSSISTNSSTTNPCRVSSRRRTKRSAKECSSCCSTSSSCSSCDSSVCQCSTCSSSLCSRSPSSHVRHKRVRKDRSYRKSKRRKPERQKKHGRVANYCSSSSTTRSKIQHENAVKGLRLKELRMRRALLVTEQNKLEDELKDINQRMSQRRNVLNRNKKR